MTAIVYPVALPAPTQWVATPRERRASSSLPGNTQLRVRSRDQITDVEASWIYSPDEMGEWRTWYEDTLLYGMRWFAIEAPGAGGWIDRVCRFRTGTVRREFLARGYFRVSAQLEQRGRSVAPRIPECDFLTLLQSRFIGNNADDESCWQWGSPTQDGGTLVGEAFVVNRNNSADPFAPSVLTYAPDGLESNGTDALVVECLATWAATPNTTGIPFFEVSFDSETHAFQWFGDAGRANYNNSGFGIEYTTPGAVPANCHFRVVFSETSTRAYIAGQKVSEAVGSSIPPASPIQVRVGDPFGYSEGTTSYTVHAFRVRQEELDTGDSFTPPTELPSVYV
jgi:hypothetical protein